MSEGEMSGDISFDFDGRTAIVTGAARGIGLEIARGFAQANATVFVVDYDVDEARAAADEVGGHALGADVSDSAAVEAAVAAAAEATGRIDILVNNAGLLRDALVWKLADDDFDRVLDVHVGGAFRFTRAVVPHFRSRQYGRIVNVTSYSGLHGNTGQANYSAAKAGVIGLTKTTAKELARFGVTVNAISPNAATRMVASIPDDKRQQLEDAIPAGRFAEPHEIWPAVGFLASREAGYITGTVLPVDGGMSM